MDSSTFTSDQLTPSPPQNNYSLGTEPIYGITGSSSAPLSLSNTQHSSLSLPTLDDKEFFIRESQAGTSITSTNLIGDTPNLPLEKSDGLLRTANARARLSVLGRRQTVVGTSGNDRIDASDGKGRNKLKGLAGRDTLLAGKRDTLLGGSGNDKLDARKGKGRNVLRGGGSNDRLWAGKRDRLFGNGGNDRLDARNARGRNFLNGGGGNDRLFAGSRDTVKGGRGADIFWIAQGQLPSEQILIQDFEDGIDRIGLTITGLDPFSDLSLTQQGQDVLLRVNGQAIALLNGITTSQLTSQDFVGLVSPEDVIGRREGNQYSETATNETGIGAQFNVFDTNNDGTPIFDTLPGTDRIGLFPNAIRDYISGDGSLTGTANPTVETFTPNNDINLSVGILKAELIDDPTQNAAFGNRDTIEYSILPSIDADPILSFRFDFTNSFDEIPGFDINQGINSLPYILETNVLTQRFAIVEGIFDSGSVFNTKVTRTYSNIEREIAGRSTLATQFSLVDRQGENFVTDQDPSATVGTFLEAIEDYTDATRSVSFALGNLSASLSGTTVTYTLSSEDDNITQSATLNLAAIGFNSNQAVNDLQYILENDLLQRAFFPA